MPVIKRVCLRVHRKTRRLESRRCRLKACSTYTERMSLTAGTKIGPYEIVALLGAGGMGEVNRGRDVTSRRSMHSKTRRVSARW